MNVAILMATYNGEAFISRQIQSIAAQTGVASHLYISDDGSQDATISVAQVSSRKYNQPIEFLRAKRDPDLCFKSAANNFYHLISSLTLPPSFDWVAFADQDDVWNSDHLFRAITQLKSCSAAGYSSSVVAFWPDGFQRFVKKHGFISNFNHLFESPGPGCTIVLPRQIFNELQYFLSTKLCKASRIAFHDWAIYAFVRSRRLKWIIDSIPSILYRQHAHNVIGVSIGYSSLASRFAKVKGGWYRQQVIAIADFCDELDNHSVQRLIRLLPLDRLILAFNTFSFRRRFRDRVILSLSFVSMSKSS
jgi:rhamnosyltransferase